MIFRGFSSVLAALMTQDLTLMKTYENYKILWIVRKDCYAHEQMVSPSGFLFGFFQYTAVMTHSFFSGIVRRSLRFPSPSQCLC